MLRQGPRDLTLHHLPRPDRAFCTLLLASPAASRTRRRRRRPPRRLLRKPLRKARQPVCLDWLHRQPRGSSRTGATACKPASGSWLHLAHAAPLGQPARQCRECCALLCFVCHAPPAISSAMNASFSNPAAVTAVCCKFVGCSGCAAVERLRITFCSGRQGTARGAGH